MPEVVLHGVEVGRPKSVLKAPRLCLRFRRAQAAAHEPVPSPKDQEGQHDEEAEQRGDKEDRVLHDSSAGNP